MRAIVNPAVLGVPVSEGGGVRGRAKKTMGMFLVGYCGDSNVALIITLTLGPIGLMSMDDTLPEGREYINRARA